MLMFPEGSGVADPLPGKRASIERVCEAPSSRNKQRVEKQVLMSIAKAHKLPLAKIGMISAAAGAVLKSVPHGEQGSACRS